MAFWRKVHPAREHVPFLGIAAVTSAKPSADHDVGRPTKIRFLVAELDGPFAFKRYEEACVAIWANSPPMW
jgi:hypothetical protein